MAGPSSISSAHSHGPSQDYEAANLKRFFAQGFDIQTADHDMLNKWVIHSLNEYATLNTEDFDLWASIRMDFGKFEAKHFDELDSSTWNLIRNYCYPHGYWIDYNIDDERTWTTVMLKAVKANWNDEWSIKQIKWVEQQYKTLSRITCERKQELTGIPDFDSTSNPEPNTAEQQTQQYQDIRFQTQPQQPIMQPSYPALSKPSPYIYQPHQAQQPQKQPPQSEQFPQQTSYPTHQPAPTPVPNLRSTSVEPYLDDSTSIDDHQPVSNSSTSEIEKDCECITECSTAPAPPVQALSVPAPSVPAPSVPVPSGPAPLIQAPTAEEAFPEQVPLAQVSLAQVPPVQALSTSAPLAANEPGRKQHGKHLEQVQIASPSNICFPMDECTNNDADAQLSQYAASGQKEIPGLFEKSCLVEQADNEKDKKLVLTQLLTMQRYLGLYIRRALSRRIHVRFSHQESRSSLGYTSGRFALELGPGCGGHASGRHTGLCSGLFERYYLSIFVT